MNVVAKVSLDTQVIPLWRMAQGMGCDVVLRNGVAYLVSNQGDSIMDVKAIIWEADARGRDAANQQTLPNKQELTPGYHVAHAAVLRDHLNEAAKKLAVYERELAWSNVALQKAEQWERAARLLLSQWRDLPPEAHRARVLRRLEPQFRQLEMLHTALGTADERAA